MNKELRIELLIESLKQKSIPFILFIAFVIFGYIQMPDLTSNTPSVVYGEVVGLRGAEGDGVRLYLDVKL